MLRLGQHCRSVAPTLAVLFWLWWLWLWCHRRSVGPTLVMLLQPCYICSNINKIKKVVGAAASDIPTQILPLDARRTRLTCLACLALHTAFCATAQTVWPCSSSVGHQALLAPLNLIDVHSTTNLLVSHACSVQLSAIHACILLKMVIWLPSHTI